MTKRKLVTIRVIKDLQPIKGADRIEVAQIDGWKTVVAKGEYEVGQKVVYFEVDSFIPVGNPAANVFKGQAPRKCEGIDGYRLMVVVLRKQSSHGLVLSLDKFPDLNLEDLEVGTDLTEMMGVIKYDPPIPMSLSGQVKGGFNFGIPKTDEERIQNLANDIPTEIAGRTFRRTMKMNGTSMTVYHNNGESGVMGRNWEYVESPNNALWSAARRYEIIDALEKSGRNLALQGELMGPGICKNLEKLPRLEFFLFRVWHIDEARFLTDLEKQELIKQLRDLGAELQTVPDLGMVTMPENVDVDYLLEQARGKSYNPQSIKEGDVYHRDDGAFSFKVINIDWQKKHEVAGADDDEEEM